MIRKEIFNYRYAILTLICLNTALYCTTHYVHPDSALNSVQAALSLCSINDTVLVGPGIYYENINWPTTQSILLMSEYGTDSTVLDGMNNYPYGVISIPPGIDTTTLIIGFTIQNGASMAYGGGIWCYQCSPSIVSNVIQYNSSNNDGGGGGIAVWQGSPIILNNVITANLGYGADGGSGLFLYRSKATVIDNSINLNEQSVAVRCVRCTLAFHKNDVSYNTDSGIDYTECTVFMDSCSLINNGGIGIMSNYSGDIVVNYCNIHGNTSYGLYNYTSTMIDAEYNWWGDMSGPYHPDSNPSGLGDSVSDYVDFTPWLDHSVCISESLKAEVSKFYKPISSTFFYGHLKLSSDIKFKIFDATGRQINTLNPAPGIYFIEINGEIRQKIIKVE